MGGQQNVLDERIEQSLRKEHSAMTTKGELISLERLNEYQELFRSRYGPDRLRELDGEALFQPLHSTAS